ncbi:MAG: hypothetical protein AVDCRST_MAG49-4748 [uncultured Thermomicrobiales bacterium]|uniref:Uncharacterized protein n=1 Tax=uncultured Thermomicrobiales bacterium TaxID=1645740 RepID=A0A6J4VJW3_9BACT|nr:MAG: hypothetical protein AVDCRST_MAG49-4748 [uncultured Thermomicrobiales bacterium]
MTHPAPRPDVAEGFSVRPWSSPCPRIGFPSRSAGAPADGSGRASVLPTITAVCAAPLPLDVRRPADLHSDRSIGL